jgi:hypothetical protein
MPLYGTWLFYAVYPASLVLNVPREYVTFGTEASSSQLSQEVGFTMRMTVAILVVTGAVGAVGTLRAQSPTAAL